MSTLGLRAAEARAYSLKTRIVGTKPAPMFKASISGKMSNVYLLVGQHLSASGNVEV